MSAFPIDRLRRSRLRVQQMELVLQLIEHGTISAAAAAMGLTQSAVTRSLQDLEALMEVTLFERSHHGVTPTRACRPVETLAHDFREGLEETARQIRAVVTGDDHALRVGAEPGMPMRMLSQAVNALLDDEPTLQVSLRCEDSASLMAAVGHGGLDLAVVRTDLGSQAERLRFHALGQQRLRVVCGIRHPLARSTHINAEQLAAQRWLLPSRDHAVTRRVDMAFSQLGLSPPTQRVEGIYSACLFPLIAQGSVLTIIDEGQAPDGLLEQKLFALPDLLNLAPIVVFAAEPMHGHQTLAVDRLRNLLHAPTKGMTTLRRRA